MQVLVAELQVPAQAPVPHSSLVVQVGATVVVVVGVAVVEVVEVVGNGVVVVVTQPLTAHISPASHPSDSPQVLLARLQTPNWQVAGLSAQSSSTQH